MPGVQTIAIEADDADQRIDRWLRRRFPQLSQGRIEKMLRKGELRVDGARAKASTRLEAGQVVRVPPMPDETPEYLAKREAERAEQRARISPADAEMIRAAVVWRDDHLIVLDKPAGLAVQGGSGQSERHVDGLSEALKFGAEERPKLVHRLDRDTSGVLVLARTAAAARALTASFRHRDTRKVYWALTSGVPDPEQGAIRWGLVKAGGRGAGGEGEKMRRVHPDEVATTEGAKRALTEYQVFEAVGNRAAWVALSPITGRTHQLRAHMAALGTPIAGDGKYGGSGLTNEGEGWGAQLGGVISRKLHLHARSLTFEHPGTKRLMTVVAPLPEHMRRTWDTFGWKVKNAPPHPFDPDRAKG
ncbi:MAG: RluA family pseudouridine synthase [Pseudomonadota bacterium]|nr:RluA family pseudouridine synthase [Pseudomonadota bacterium]